MKLTTTERMIIMTKNLSDSTIRMLDEYASNVLILQMKNFFQHRRQTTYDHCLHVAICSAIAAEKLGLPDHKIENIIIGAMLHDYFLYDWHDGRRRKEGIHCWSHPKTALRNACEYFTLNKKQKNIIRAHMFPVTILHMPTCIESWIVCIADKICATIEYMNAPNGYKYANAKRRLTAV